MTARVYFAVLLCLSGCLSTTEAALGRSTVKPGVCPRRKYEAAMCPQIRFLSCANDSDCANNEKCCSNGCGLQCMAPVTGVEMLLSLCYHGCPESGSVHMTRHAEEVTLNHVDD
ncbi:hypothetical protein PO909_013714 [Leuciscus waleckii]